MPPTSRPLPHDKPERPSTHGAPAPHTDAPRPSEVELDRFFELSLDMLCIANAESYFTRLNPAFTRTLGWSLEERRVQERTAELQQRNRDLETLLYVSSHDLREPLRSISNFSQLVRERYGACLDAKGLDYIDRVIRAAQRMDQLMEDLLTLSRAQRMEMPYEEVRGEDLVKAALAQLDETIRRTRARIQVATDFPSFRVNAQIRGQVL